MSSVGVQIFNDQGIELVNTNDPMLVVLDYRLDVYFPNGGFGSVLVPYSGWPESPTVLIRPRAGAWYGWFRLEREGDNVRIWLDTRLVGVSSISPFDVAVACSPRAAAVRPSQGYGLETFGPDGQLLFSSAFRFPRIRQIAQVPGPNLQVAGSTTSAAITYGADTMPWVIARDAMQSVAFASSEPSTASAVGFYFSVNASRTAISVRADDTTNNRNNQYWGRFLRFPLCIIQGI